MDRKQTNQYQSLRGIVLNRRGDLTYNVWKKDGLVSYWLRMDDEILGPYDVETAKEVALTYPTFGKPGRPRNDA